MDNKSLKLRGGKMRLEWRPLYNTMTASAKNDLLLKGPERSKRPASVIPMLSLDCSQKHEDFPCYKEQRSYSAKIVLPNTSRDEGDCDQSKTLSPSVASDILEDISQITDSNSCTSSHISLNQSATASSELIPGIKQKPPLPPTSTSTVKTNNTRVLSSSDEITTILEDIRGKSNSQIETIKKIVGLDLQLTINDMDKPQTSNTRTFKNSKIENVFRYLDEVDNNSVSDEVTNSLNVAAVQKELTTLRKEKLSARRELEDKIKQLQLQKKHQDEVVKRHQKIIDQLMADKVALNKRAEELLTELERREQRYKNNMKAKDNQHVEELRKARDMTLAGEKARREEWMIAEKKKIKNSTIKSVDSEIKSMTARFTNRETEFHEWHKHELEKFEIAMSKKQHQELEHLRKIMTTAKEEAVVLEREKCQARYNETMASEQKQYEEQRKRWMKEHAERNKECEAREQAANEERVKAVERAKLDGLEQLDAIKEKHKRDLAVAKDEMTLNFKMYKNDLTKQMEQVLEKKELEIRKMSQVERDKEIERVIDEFQKEMSKVKNLHSTQITSSQYDHNKAIEKIELRLLECENERSQAYQNIKNLDVELNKLKERELTKKQEFFEVITEKTTLQQRIIELENQQTNLAQENSRVLDAVHDRIRETIARKDEHILKLTDRIKVLEDALRDQFNPAIIT